MMLLVSTMPCVEPHHGRGGGGVPNSDVLKVISSGSRNFEGVGTRNMKYKLSRSVAIWSGGGGHGHLVPPPNLTCFFLNQSWTSPPLVLRSIIIGFYRRRRWILFCFRERSSRWAIFHVWHTWFPRDPSAVGCVCEVRAWRGPPCGKSHCGISTEKNHMTSE